MKKRFSPKVMAATFLLGILFSLFSFVPAFAQQSPPSIDSIPSEGEWVDQAYIRYNNALYYDRDIYDPTNEYRGEADGDCDSFMSVKNKFSSGTEAELTYRKPASTGRCQEVGKKTITLKKAEQRAINAYWADDAKTTLFMNQYWLKGGWDSLSTEEKGFFKQIPRDDERFKEEHYWLFADGSWLAGCESPPGEGDPGTWVNINEKKQKTRNDSGQICGADDSVDVYIAADYIGKPPEDVYGKIDAARGVVTSDEEDQDSLADVPGLDCEVKLTNPLTWLACPIIEAAKGAVEVLDNVITSQLTVRTDELFNEKGPDNSPGKALFNTWGAFRYISLGILVIIGLVMIISQAMSFAVFDAYTIKKVLPKILIGVIGITLSWYLCKFAIEIFNDLGTAVRSLLYGPFKNIGAGRIDQGASSLLAVGAGVAVVGLGIVGILSFALTALLAVIIAIAILVFRRILIILLVVTAPIAIVCWILPNTQKIWNMWWDFFIRALIVFPIIALFISGGRVIAQIATLEASSDPDAATNFLGSAIAFIAYFGPYFALPAAFRLAGGAIATLGGIANDRSRGVFDRLKKGRQERMATNFAKASSGKRWNPDSRIGRTKLGSAFNTGAGMIASPHEYAAYYANKKLPGGFARGAAISSSIDKSTTEQTLKLAEEMRANQFNDKALKVTSGNWAGLTDTAKEKLGKAGLKDGQALKSVAEFQAAANALKGTGDHTEELAADSIGRMSGRLGTIHGDKDMLYASVAGAALFEQSRQGFADGVDIATVANNIGGETGDMVAKQASLIAQSQRPDTKYGYGVLKGRDGSWQSLYQKDGTLNGEVPNANARAKDLFSSIKQQDWLGAKSGAVKTQSGVIREIANQTVKDAAGNTVYKRHAKDGIGFDSKGNQIAHRAGALMRDSQGRAVPEYTDEAKVAQEIIQLGASAYSSSDADAKTTWKGVAGDVAGLSDHLTRADQYRALMEDAGSVGGDAAGGSDAAGGAH